MLHAFTPSWNTWRPHGATLVLLRDVLTHLERGRLVQPVRPGANAAYDQSASSAAELTARIARAGEILGEIEDRFPETVQLVNEYASRRPDINERRW